MLTSSQSLIADSDPSTSPTPSVPAAPPMAEPLTAKPAARTYGRSKPPHTGTGAGQSESDDRTTRHAWDVVPETDQAGAGEGPGRRGLIEHASESEAEREGEGEGDGGDSSEGDWNAGQSEEEDDYMAKFRKKSVAEELAALESSDDEVDDAAIEAAMRAALQKPSKPATSQPANLNVPPSDSTLTSLVASESGVPPSTSLTLPHSRANTADKHNPFISSPALLDAMAATLPPVRAALNSSSESGDDSAAPFARKKVPRRIVDSDDDDDGGDERQAQVRATATDGNASSPAEAMTKKEKMEALARKRAPLHVKDKARPAREDRSGSVIVTDSDDDLTAKPKSKRKGQLSKKDEEQMNRETANLQRTQNVRLVARVKAPVSIADILKKVNERDKLKPLSSRRPPPTANPKLTATTPQPAAADLISSESVIEATSPPLSAKALGKQRARPDSSDDATPLPRRTLPRSGNDGQATRRIVLEKEEEDEMELPSLDDLVQQTADKKKADEKAERERMARLAANLATKAANFRASDSDSDLEISGVPVRVLRGSSIGIESPRLSRSERKMRDLGGPKWGHHPAPVTESQLDRAAHTFGANLGEGHHILFGAANSKASRTKADKRELAIGRDELDAILAVKIMDQNLHTRTKAQKKARGRQAAEPVRRVGPGDSHGVGIDAGLMLKAKAERLQAAKENGEDLNDDDDESEDGNYQEEYALESDIEVGSASEDGRGSGSEQEDDHAASGSEKENEDPTEPVPDADKENRRVLDDEEDDDEETTMAPPAHRRKLVRVLQSDDEDDDEGEDDDEDEDVVAAAQLVQPATPPKAAGRIELPDVFGAGFGAGDDGGFSQFFDGGLSQDDQEAGFRLPNEDGGFAIGAVFMNPINITEKERLEDAQQLEAEAVFKVSATPATPREAEPPRQYINKHGYMTQTRPVDLYEDSPGGESQPFSQVRGGSHYSQTQQTPTAKGRRPLGRLGSLLSHRESSELELQSTEVQPEPTEVAPTEVEPTEVQLDDDDVAMDDLALPSAAQAQAQAQPQPNVFEALKAAQAKEAAREERRVLKRTKNAFIENEADLSDDELLGGMAGLSGDENEDGLDAELESLVDNDEVDRDLQDEQDVLARERHAEELAKAEAADLLRAQRIADGRERTRRKNGGVDLSDDDFDDDTYGQSKRDRNQARAENKTIAQLHADEETQAFASNFNEGLVVPVETGQYSFLAEPASDDDSQVETDREEDYEENDDGDEEEEEVGAPKARLTAREADRLAVEESRKRKLAERENQQEFDRQDKAKRMSIAVDTDDEDEFGLGLPKSPAAHKVKLITRTSRILATAEPVEYAAEESQYSLFSAQTSTQAAKDMARYRSDASAKDDSQGGGNNGQTSGARSSVTSFAQRNHSAKSRELLENGKFGPAKPDRKASKFSALRKSKSGVERG